MRNFVKVWFLLECLYKWGGNDENNETKMTLDNFDLIWFDSFEDKREAKKGNKEIEKIIFNLPII